MFISNNCWRLAINVYSVDDHHYLFLLTSQCLLMTSNVDNFLLKKLEPA